MIFLYDSWSFLFVDSNLDSISTLAMYLFTRELPPFLSWLISFFASPLSNWSFLFHLPWSGLNLSMSSGYQLCGRSMVLNVPQARLRVLLASELQLTSSSLCLYIVFVAFTYHHEKFPRYLKHLHQIYNK